MDNRERGVVSHSEDPSSCFYCGLPDEWIPSRFSFGLLSSHFISGNKPFHYLRINHRDRTFCGGQISIFSCQHRTHAGRDGPIMFSRPLYFRKRIVRRPLEGGVISKSDDAYF